jgi:hypothetical protein
MGLLIPGDASLTFSPGGAALSAGCSNRLPLRWGWLSNDVPAGRGLAVRLSPMLSAQSVRKLWEISLGLYPMQQLRRHERWKRWCRGSALPRHARTGRGRSQASGLGGCGGVQSPLPRRAFQFG